jgi:FdhE protein
MKMDSWENGHCPVCGGEPAVAYLAGEGGKRFLICHRCETRWRFPRMVCPFCGKESPGESGYLYVEEPLYKGMTGHVCDDCGQYLKTWRVEEDLGDLHPEVEDLKTPAFDAALESEGYSRGGANVFGVLVGGGVREEEEA